MVGKLLNYFPFGAFRPIFRCKIAVSFRENGKINSLNSSNPTCSWVRGGVVFLPSFWMSLLVKRFGVGYHIIPSTREGLSRTHQQRVYLQQFFFRKVPEETSYPLSVKRMKPKLIMDQHLKYGFGIKCSWNWNKYNVYNYMM